MNKYVKWIFMVSAMVLIVVVSVFVIETTIYHVTKIITEPLKYSWYEINPPPGEEGKCFMVIIEPTFLQRYSRKTVSCIGSLSEASNMDYSEVLWDEFDHPAVEHTCYGVVFEFEAFKEGQGVGPNLICP